ncbi:hypothetical protein [Kitasatospora indigofera]|uniref:hypothetical protein n=1 Tax=Kitasatospora indigofera TaxID=67307 RepID=UPI0036CF0177
MVIKWDQLSQPLFDEIVEALIHRLQSGGSDVQAVNGRGGDDGVDILVRTGEGEHIYQLKYYPDGFATSAKGRRSGIRKSFVRAAGRQPHAWTLVVPCTVSHSERSFVEGLPNGRPIAVSIMDRTALNTLMATHSDLEFYFNREHLLEAAKIFNRERDILLGGTQDITERVSALSRQIDTVDPHWTVDFVRQGDKIIQTLVGKHPRAHEVSPVRIHLTGRRAALGPDLASALERTMGFGVAEEVVLPAEAVERLTVDGPEWLSRTHENVEVAWYPIEPAPLAGTDIEVTFLDGNAREVASYSGRLNGLGSGTLGRSIEATVCGSGRLRLLHPFDASTPAKLNFTFDLGRSEPSEALRILGLHQQLLSGGDFQVTAKGSVLGAGHLPPSRNAAERARLTELQMYVSDLDTVQRHCQRFFPVPFDVSAAQRIALRVARLVIDGACVISPFTSTLTMTLNGSNSPALREVLAGQPGALSVGLQGYELHLGERVLNIGAVNIYHPRAAAEDGIAALAALEGGHAEGMKVTVRPLDDGHFRLYRPDVPDPNVPLVPVPLGLNGFPEPR